MPDDVVRLSLELIPGIAGNPLKYTIRTLDATLEIGSGEEQLLYGKIARFVNRFNQRGILLVTPK
jgi:hypothetical protein